MFHEWPPAGSKEPLSLSSRSVNRVSSLAPYLSPLFPIAPYITKGGREPCPPGSLHSASFLQRPILPPVYEVTQRGCGRLSSSTRYHKQPIP